MNYLEEICFDADRPFLPLSDELMHDIVRMGATRLGVRPVDPRCHSADQRKKVFALCREIAWHWGWYPEEMRAYLMDVFIEKERIEPFSMSDVDMDTCSGFISSIVDHCLEHGVPTKYPLGQYADDIEQYLRLCLLYCKCSICGRDADLHHVDAIQMGHDRNKVNHLGRRAIALCRVHHDEAHAKGVKTFFDLHHLPHGIKLDEYLCDKLGLNTKEGKWLIGASAEGGV